MLILGIQSDHIRMSICILIPVACNSPPTGSLRLPGGRYRHYTNSKQTAKLVLKIIHLNDWPGSGLSLSVGIKLPDESIYGIMGDVRSKMASDWWTCFTSSLRVI